MPLNRTSTESNNDEQTTKDSEEAFRQEDHTKRGNLAPFSDTTLQDIPTEILHCILIKVVAMEVKNMKLAKSVWKEKADLVIERLENVCLQWRTVLNTSYFRIQLHRALDDIAQQTIRLEILSESIVNNFVYEVATLKDEILMFCLHYHQHSVTSAVHVSTYYSIGVYDRNNLKEVKEVIALPGISNGGIAACNVSNCVYVLDINEELHCASILRIARNEEQKFNIQTWISDLRLPIASGSLSVSDKGNLMIIKRSDGPGPTAVAIYNLNGFLQHEVMLSPDIYGFTCNGSKVIQKSNGNLVLDLVNGQSSQMSLTEIDTNGNIQRQYKSSYELVCLMSSADNSGRILRYDVGNRIELLDSELNLLDFNGPQPNEDEYDSFKEVHFNSERNEVMGISTVDAEICLLTIFRFIEE